jgi:transcriptional regulator with XRE-family HTH domain
VGLILRALRRRRAWTQARLAARAGCSQALVSAAERGHLEGVTVERLRRLFGALDGRLRLAPSWRGAELDRLLDEDHAAIEHMFAHRLEAATWTPLLEVTYAIGGERGSIDVLGVRPDSRSALVAEIKSDIPSAEAVGRKLDEKRRLAPAIVRARLGWTPEVVGAMLVLPESNRLRRLLEGPAASLARSFPIDSRAAAAWLRDPDVPLAATWFLSNISPRNARRVRSPSRPSQRASSAPVTLPSNANDDWDEPPQRILR